MRTMTRKDRPPIHGWRYFIPELKIEVSADSFEELKTRVRKIYLINETSAPQDLDALIEEFICSHIAPRYCRGEAARGSANRVTLSQLSAGVRAITEAINISVFKGSASVKVGQNEANRRAEICAGCEFNTTTESCWSCVIKDIALFMIVDDKDQTRFDQRLFSCDICGCPNKGTVHMVPEVIIASEKKRNLKYPAHCWKNEVLDGRDH